MEHALLEGDFVLRSGKRSTWYLDKYRFETRPDLLRELGARLAEVVRDVEPDTTRLGGPALGAVALAASASMASELPFIIVRSEIKEYGTANRIEGPFEPGDLVCLLEDVVTSGGALAESVSALREAGLVVRNAVCVVDREEGGTDALARVGVRLRSLYRAGDLLAGRPQAEQPARSIAGIRPAVSSPQVESTQSSGGRRRKPAWLSQSRRSVRVSGGPTNDHLVGGVE